MPRGAPDYLAPDTTVSTVNFDSSELLVGLQGVKSIDGRGSAIYADRFNQGLDGFRATCTNGANLPHLSTSYPYVFLPPVGVLLDPVAAGKKSFIYREIGAMVDSSFGVEVAFRFYGQSSNMRIHYSHIGGNGVEYIGEVRYDAPDSKLYITSGGVDVEILDTSLYSNNISGWVAFKMVMDFKRDRYKRFVFGTQDIDINDYQLEIGGVGALGSSVVTVSADGDGVFIDPVGVGYVILTIDEP